MKYEILEYQQEVVGLLKKGWRINYDCSDFPCPSTWLYKKGKDSISISNWTLDVLWSNGLLVSDGKYPRTSYQLITRKTKIINFFKSLFKYESPEKTTPQKG